MKFAKNRRKLAAAVLLSAALSTVGCGLLPEKEETRVAPVADSLDEMQFEYVDVIQADVTEVYKVPLSYNANDSISLFFGENGVRVSAVYVSKGDIVKKGDLLLEGDNEKIKEEIETLNQSIAEYNNNIAYYTAMIEAETEKKLICAQYAITYDNTVLSGYEDMLDACQKSLNVAKMQLDEAASKLENYRIYAPYDGTVGYVAQVSVYETVSSYEAVATVLKDETYFYTTTDEPDYFQVDGVYTCNYDYSEEQVRVSGTGEDEDGVINKNNRESIAIDVFDYSDTVEVKCTSIECKNESTGVYEVRFQPLGEVKSIAPTDMSISFEIASAENVLCVPKEVLIKANDAYAVYLLNEDGSRKVQTVEIGIVSDSLAEVQSGLSLGDRVINWKTE